MADITGTKQSLFSTPGGTSAIVTVTATIESASDDIILTQADHGITAITSILGLTITAGHDNAFTVASASFSSLTLTVVSLKATGAASDSWGDTTISITVLGTL